MIIKCNDLLEGEQRLSFSYPSEHFPVLTEMSAAGECAFPEPIAFSLRAQKAADMIEVDGGFVTRLQLRCSRCLKTYETNHQTAVSLTYAREPSESMPQMDGEFKPSSEEAGLIPYQGDEIDLLEGLQEQVVLSIPYRPLCSDACKGICPRCGADLNRGDCGCREETPDPRFEALKDL